MELCVNYRGKYESLKEEKRSLGLDVEGKGKREYGSDRLDVDLCVDYRGRYGSVKGEKGSLVTGVEGNGGRE